MSISPSLAISLNYLNDIPFFNTLQGHLNLYNSKVLAELA